MQNNLNRLLAIALVCAAPAAAAGQMTTSKYELGVHLGTLVYQGDLAPGYAGHLKKLHPAAGIAASRHLGNYFALRLGVTRGRLSGADSAYSSPAWRKARNFSFTTPVTEVAATMVFAPFGSAMATQRRLTPYVFAGAGATFINVRKQYNYDTTVFDYKSIVARGLATDTLRGPKAIAVLPVGGGLQYRLSDSWAINLEGTMRLTPTDYLDGFSQAANPKSRDRYWGLSLGIAFRPGGYRCPRVL